MSEKKPLPLLRVRSPSRCPVCGQGSYSRAGIHPQCAARQADEKRKVRLKQEALTAAEETATFPAVASAPWQRSCPKCRALQHVRTKVCSCGHTFAAQVRPPAGEAGCA